eukprot:scaffold35524_cov73-Skeletonema_marinoi.AAC.1
MTEHPKRKMVLNKRGDLVIFCAYLRSLFSASISNGLIQNTNNAAHNRQQQQGSSNQYNN